jgi:hypothetical protein
MAYCLRCPDCRGKFPWIAGEKIPDFCPLCGEKVAGQDRADDDVVMPFLRKATTDRTDKLYRDMEAGSEVRAQAAAELAGVPVSEMSDLKMTDMKDHLRPGDISAVESKDAENRLKAASPHSQWGFQGEGKEHAAGVASGAVNINGKIVQGIEPHAGARAAQRIQRAFGRA